MGTNTDEQLAEELKNEPGLSDRPRKNWTPEMEEKVERERQQHVLAATIAGLSWGRQMSPVLRRAFAAYCARYDVDPITEMDNLGGAPYVNAEWYLRKLGELIVRGIVKDYSLDHIQADPRLLAVIEDEEVPEDMRLEARKKWFANLMKRIEHNAPDEAAAICVCSLFLPTGTVIKGCKWAGNGTSIVQPRHGGGSQPNPVTEINPTLSVESQSIRRALRQLVTHVSAETIRGLNWPKIEAMERELEDLQVRTDDIRVEQKDAAATAQHEPKALAAVNYGEGDASEIERRINERREAGVPVEATLSDTPRTPMPIFSAASDPYGGFEIPPKPPSEPKPTREEREAEKERKRVESMRAVHIVERLAARDVSEGELLTDKDLFGTTTAVEDVASECELCGLIIRPGHPEDHDELCDAYVAP